ncbi:MAG: hypothetical protein QM731_25975 [Chitinophagaceae bacterium]
MKKYLIVGGIILCVLGFRLTDNGREREAKIATAVRKSVLLLQQSSHTFITNAHCFSCHGQAMGAVVFSMAKIKGFELNDTLAAEASQKMALAAKSGYARFMFMEHNEILGGSISTGYVLWGLAAAGYKPGKTISLMVHQLLERQTANGNWAGGNGRPPMEYYSFSATALAIKGLQDYATPGLQKQVADAKVKAQAWLLKTIPFTNEERAFQLLGLTWTNTDKAVVREKAGKLLALQHADGGWSQLDSLSTDAYATGQSLYALYEAGILNVNDSVFLKGIDFLLRTQHDDGSWEIQSRTMPSIPYVNSGFPYGKNQFISAAGSSWATMALLLAAK